MISFKALRHELRPTVWLALRLVLAEIGWMSREESPPSKTRGTRVAFFWLMVSRDGKR